MTLTPEGEAVVRSLAERHGVSRDAVLVVLEALRRSGGGMAQFDHPDLGGMGQWSQGGMLMIGDMFNHGLKARVAGLCADAAQALASSSFEAPPAQFQSQGQRRDDLAAATTGPAVSLFVEGPGEWPAELGRPSSVGSQNDLSYAVFPATRRLAIRIGGRVTVYDTADHLIGGVSQQQSGGASLTFTSQRGLVRLDELAVVSGGAPVPPPTPSAAAAPARATAATAPAAPATAPAAPAPTPAAPGPGPSTAADDVIATIERLAGLRDRGILSEPEFAAKKAELLARL